MIHLLRHGLQFRTLIPSNIHAKRLVKNSPELEGFSSIPAIPDLKVPRTIEQYKEYVEMREKVMKAPEAQAAYRMGGILWRLAMESTANFHDIIDHIMDGPCEVSCRTGEYFYINDKIYYDDNVSPHLVLAICGVHGAESGGEYCSIVRNLFIYFIYSILLAYPTILEQPPLEGRFSSTGEFNVESS